MFSTIFFVLFSLLIIAHFVLLKDREAILNSVAVAFVPSAVLLLILSFVPLSNAATDAITGTLMLVITALGLGYQYSIARRSQDEANDETSFTHPE